MSWSDKRLSKFLSLLLRHRPQEIGLRLDPAGWARVEDLVRKAREHGAPLSPRRLRALVEGQEKPRFSFSEDGERIRANYGHSLDLDLELEELPPPEHLFHGTARGNLASILREGVDARSRSFVHLSEDRRSARTVGRRHGEPVIVPVRAARMAEAGHAFYRPAPGIWLVERVPPRFLGEPEE